jgi:plastocyanin
MGVRFAGLALLSSIAIVSPTSGAERIRVTVDKMKFEPAEVSAHVGDTIEWLSSDFVAHTATARNNEWDVSIPAKGVGHVTLKHTGDVDYFCRFHPNMTARISVGAQ